MNHAPACSVLLTGATGQVGIFAIPRLLSAGFRLVALSRKIDKGMTVPAPSPQGEVQWIHPDRVLTPAGDEFPDNAQRWLGPVEVLLSLGPLDLSVELARGCPRLRQVICLSTSSLYTKMSSPDSAERALLERIRAAENSLKKYCAQGAIPLFLLRPTMIYGCGLDRNISRIARLVRRWRFFPVAGRAAGLRQPVHADDLAALCVALLDHGSLTGIESPVGGGSVISYRQMVERIFAGLGLTPRILQLPPAVLTGLVRSVSWLPGLDGLNPEFVRRQNRDLVFDDSGLREQLGFSPRPFNPGPADFEVPELVKSCQPRVQGPAGAS